MRSVIIGPSLCLCTFSLVANTLFSHRLQSQPCIKLWIALSVLRGTGRGETQTNEPCITLFLIAFFGLDIADNFWDNPSFIGLQFAHLLACLPHSMLLVWLVCPWDRPSKLLFFYFHFLLPTSYFSFYFFFYFCAVPTYVSRTSQACPVRGTSLSQLASLSSNQLGYVRSALSTNCSNAKGSNTLGTSFGSMYRRVWSCQPLERCASAW